MTVYGLHSRIVETLFGASWSDQAVTFTLVRLGLAFTVFQMVTVLLPAPYGRHRDVAPAILKCTYYLLSHCTVDLLRGMITLNEEHQLLKLHLNSRNLIHCKQTSFKNNIKVTK